MNKREFIEQYVITHCQYYGVRGESGDKLFLDAEYWWDQLESKYPLEATEKPVERLLDKADRLGYLD